MYLLKYLQLNNKFQCDGIRPVHNSTEYISGQSTRIRY